MSNLVIIREDKTPMEVEFERITKTKPFQELMYIKTIVGDKARFKLPEDGVPRLHIKVVHGTAIIKYSKLAQKFHVLLPSETDALNLYFKDKLEVIELFTIEGKADENKKDDH